MSDDLDRVIDDVARRMTEGEAPVDLRARVLAQLATNPESRISNPGRARSLWTLAPIAAAALIIVGVFIARSSSVAPLKGRPTYDQPSSRTLDTAAAGDGAKTVMAPETTHRDASRFDVGRRFSRANRRAARTADATSDIDTLAPPPIETPSIAISAMTPESIAVPPLETIAPIPVVPLATPEGERP